MLEPDDVTDLVQQLLWALLIQIGRLLPLDRNGFCSYNISVVGPALQSGLITKSPGIVIGETQYDYQTNGATGNRVVVDNLGGRHFIWMKGHPYPSTRSVYFNYCDPGGDWPLPEGGQPVSQANGAGYTQISMTSDDRAAVAYHETALNCVTYAEDQVSGFGIFEYYDPPDFMGDTLFFATKRKMSALLGKMF